MWWLICERYWFLLITYPVYYQTVQAQWRKRAEHHSWYARTIRAGLVNQAKMAVEQHLSLIQTLATLLPLLGVLGTVSGMIKTFQAIVMVGAPTPQLVAGGISEALITTMAGLVTSLSGLYFNAHLQRQAQRTIQRTIDGLSID